jgi:hypothetical protein
MPRKINTATADKKARQQFSFAGCLLRNFRAQRLHFQVEPRPSCLGRGHSLPRRLRAIIGSVGGVNPSSKLEHVCMNPEFALGA